MGRRIDLGDDDSQDSLEEAMKQLERQQRAAREKPRAEKEEAKELEDDDEAKRRFEAEREADHEQSREGIQDAIEQIGVERREALARRPARAPSPVKWIVIGLLLAGLIVVGVIALRPVPLPDPAMTPQEAVRGFWDELIEGNYDGATVYYPFLVERYGSQRQAANHLASLFEKNPPVSISFIGEPEPLPDSGDIRVTYEVFLQNGRPRTGDFIIRDSGSEEVGYVIITAP